MTLSIASNAAGYGKPLGYGLAGLMPIASDTGVVQRSGAVASWTYAPSSAGAGRRDAGLSSLMAVLSRFSPVPDTTDGAGDTSGSLSDDGPARSHAADLLQALNDIGRQSSSVPHPQPVQVLAQRPATDIMPALQPGLPAQAAAADPSISTAEAQLQALFKTLQAYGL